MHHVSPRPLPPTVPTSTQPKKRSETQPTTKSTAGAPSLRTRGVICESVNVLGATYANCDGRYEFLPGTTVEWAPDRPVFKHVGKDR